MPLRVHLHNKPVWRFIFGKSWENNLALPLIEGTTSTRVTSPSGGGGSVDDDDRRTAPHRASTSPPERHTTGEGVVCFTQGCSCSSSSTRRSYVDPPFTPVTLPLSSAQMSSADKSNPLVRQVARSAASKRGEESARGQVSGRHLCRHRCGYMGEQGKHGGFGGERGKGGSRI